MALLRVESLQKRFGATPVLADVSFALAEGECIALLGPSGCGKTTTLRCIAGLEHPDGGRILLEDRVLNGEGRFVMPQERQMGLVFQSYSVWPHLTVYENVAFGLKLRRASPPEIRERVTRILELMAIAPLAERRSWQLSGGQLQRVALARTLVVQPRVVLFDEPLSNLDAKLRLHMRVEIRSLLKRLGMSAVYVTHDQGEASVVADRTAVMNQGRIEQLGTWSELYHAPASRFVADFMGSGSVLEARVTGREGAVLEISLGEGMPPLAIDGAAAPGLRAGDRLEVCVLREALSLRDPGSGMIAGRITSVQPGPGVVELAVEIGAGRSLTTVKLAGEALPAEGEACGVDIDPRHLRIVGDATRPAA